MIKEAKYKLKGFTIAELLVVLALSSISISLSYGTLTYTQRLFSEYKKQNRLLNEFTDLKKRLDYESLKSDLVLQEKDNCFVFKRDSIFSRLQLLEHNILLSSNNRCDTFHIKAKDLKVDFEPMTNPLWINKLIGKMSFDVEYRRQKFSFLFFKEHSSAIKLMLDKEEGIWQ